MNGEWIGRIAAFRNWFVFGLLFQCLCLSSTGSAQAQSASASLYPESTVFHISAGNVPTFVDAFESTDLGKMFSNPELKPFLEDLQTQLETKFANQIQRNGLSIEDLRQIKSGEVAFGMLLFERPGKGVRAGSVFLVEARNQSTQAAALLEKISANLIERKAKAEPDYVREGQTLKHFVLKREGGEIEKKQVYFGEVAGWIIVANELEVLEPMLDSLLAGKSSRPLSATPTYQLIRSRLAATSIIPAPQMTWYAAPFPLANAIRNAQVEPGKTSRYLQAMEQTGFASIQGIGGDLSFAVDDNEFLYQTYIAVPGQGGLGDRLNQSARMLSFNPPANAGPLTPIDAVRASSASVMTWYWNTGDVFAAMEPLVDQLYGEDTFKRVVNDIRTAETQVDLEQLAASLGPRFALASEMVEPLEGTSEKMLLVVELSEPQAAQQNLRNYLKADWYQLQELKDRTDIELWLFEGEPDDGGGVGDPLNVLNPGGGDEVETEEEESLLLGMKAFAFSERYPGWMLAANDVDYLLDVVDSAEGIVKNTDYGRLEAKLRSLLKGEPVLYRFSLPARVHELSYQLLRSGKLPESETQLELTLRMLLGTETGVVRPQEIDGSKMPADFKTVVAPYLGPSGWVLGVDDGGWIIVGAGLKSAP